jgi:enamine deaminase RidA (YjgF/YER057c/UK114 family)
VQRPTRISARLGELGYRLPAVPGPRGRYASARLDLPYVHVSGHTDRGVAGQQGPLDRKSGLDLAREAARLAAVNLLAAAATVVDLDTVEGPLHLRGYVASAPDFQRHPEVIDAASELLHQAFPSAPPHTRAAIGVSSLPGGAVVELECVLRLGS